MRYAWPEVAFKLQAHANVVELCWCAGTSRWGRRATTRCTTGYQAFEATHFPDPMGLRQTVARWSLGLYPNCLKFAMAVFDIPESIAVTRKLLCQSGVGSVTRIQVLLPASVEEVRPD